MANTDVFSHLLSSDVYDVAEAVNAAKSQYISEDEQTLAMGLFGYIGSVETAKIQSNIIMASELSNEVFPNRAKYDRNIMTHAMMYDILDVNAEPANIHVVLYIKRSDIEKYSKDDMFVIDRKCPIYISDPEDSNSDSYEFHLDYNVILTKVTVNFDEEVYTARYDTSTPNNISKITNPYIGAPLAIVLGGETYIGVQVTLSQVTLTDTYEKLISSSIIDNKTFIFSHQDQMADFMIYVTENGVTTAITPIYEGASVPDNVNKFCYYLYLDSEKVRVKFERTSYMPGLNAEIEVKMQTTRGYEGNFKYMDTATFATLTSEAYGYSNVESMVYIQSNSENGLDSKSSDELRKIIPKEALARGAISTSADLNNYFNQLNTEDNKILLSKKVDNQIENTQYAHLLLKDIDSNIVPTNTIKIMARKCDFRSSSDTRYVIPAGAIIEYDAEAEIGNLIYIDIEENGIEDLVEGVDTPAEEVPDIDEPALPDDLDPELKAINEAARAAVKSLSTNTVDPDAETRLEDGISDYDLTTSSVDVDNPPTQDSKGEDYDTILMADGEDQGGNGTELEFTGNETVVDDPTYKVVDNISYVKAVTDPNVNRFIYLVTDEKGFEIDPNNHKLFYYTNPYTIVINADDELYAAYYLCVIDETRILNYKYINQNSDIQFISNTIKWYRRFLTDANSYKLDITLTQNLQKDVGLYQEDKTVDEDGNEVVNVLVQKVKVILVLYRNGVAYRYAEGNFQSFNETNYSFNFQFVMDTKNIILDTENNIRIENLGICGQSGRDYGYFPGNTAAYIYTLIEDGGAGGRHDLDNYVSGLENYTVTNMFEVDDGVNFFVNYSGIMSSKVDACNVEDPEDTSYVITSLPVIGYQYALNEDLFDAFVNQLNYKKAYIDNANEKMQNPFGVDFKFFNTYGPSKLFTLDNDSQYINRVNIQLNFRLKLSTSHDAYAIDYIKRYIKEEAIEKLNEEYSLHIPNLITNVTNKFRESLVYFEFLGIDNYGPGVQHIYHKDVKYDDPEYINMVPEFINVNLVYDEDLNKTPDINIEVV